MEPTEEQQSSASSRFFKGFISSAGRSAVMMGIMYAVSLGVSFVFPEVHLVSLLSAAILTTSIGIFGGIMAVMNGKEQSKPAERETDERNVVIGVTAPGLGVVVAPDVAPTAPEVAPTEAVKSNWTERADIKDRTQRTVAEIIADGASPKSHAAAILEKQQAAAAKPASVA